MTLYIPDISELGLTDLDTEWWLTRRRWTGHLEPVNVADLGERHRRNLLAWLRDHAALLARTQRRVYVHLHNRGSIDTPELAHRLDWLDAHDPHAWLEDTALVRRLVDLPPAPPRPPRRNRQLPRRLTGARR